MDRLEVEPPDADEWCRSRTGSKWSCLLLRIVLRDALSEVTKIHPLLKLMVFVDDITALVKGRNREVAEKGKEVDEEIERRGREERAQIVSDRRWEGKSKMIASCGFMEEELHQCSKERE